MKKITKEDQIKMWKKVNRELALDKGSIKTGPHMTEKDRPRKKKVELDECDSREK